MANQQKFLEWIEKQDYRVSKSKVEEKFPDIELELEGITIMYNDKGEIVIPRRDLRKSAIRKKREKRLANGFMR